VWVLFFGDTNTCPGELSGIIAFSGHIAPSQNPQPQNIARTTFLLFPQVLNVYRVPTAASSRGRCVKRPEQPSISTAYWYTGRMKIQGSVWRKFEPKTCGSKFVRGNPLPKWSPKNGLYLVRKWGFPGWGILLHRNISSRCPPLFILKIGEVFYSVSKPASPPFGCKRGLLNGGGGSPRRAAAPVGLKFGFILPDGQTAKEKNVLVPALVPELVGRSVRPVYDNATAPTFKRVATSPTIQSFPNARVRMSVNRPKTLFPESGHCCAPPNPCGPLDVDFTIGERPAGKPARVCFSFLFNIIYQSKKGTL